MPHFEITNNWKEPKEDGEMTQEQFNKFMDNWLAERRSLTVSDWAEKDLEQAKEEGITDGTAPAGFCHKGTGGGNDIEKQGIKFVRQTNTHCRL